MIPLKLCPFCGGIPTVTPWHGGAKTKRMISCDNDACEVQPLVTGHTRAAAARRWNQRPETAEAAS